jgi:hypothetical protein
LKNIYSILINRHQFTKKKKSQLLPGGGMRMMNAMSEVAVLIIKMKSYTIDKDFIKEF